jgi:hypothetical protein
MDPDKREGWDAMLEEPIEGVTGGVKPGEFTEEQEQEDFMSALTNLGGEPGAAEG